MYAIWYFEHILEIEKRFEREISCSICCGTKLKFKWMEFVVWKFLRIHRWVCARKFQWIFLCTRIFVLGIESDPNWIHFGSISRPYNTTKFCFWIKPRRMNMQLIDSMMQFEWFNLIRWFSDLDTILLLCNLRWNAIETKNDWQFSIRNFSFDFAMLSIDIDIHRSVINSTS